jgi:predicted PurR-regulated permease PerM
MQKTVDSPIRWRPVVRILVVLFAILIAFWLASKIPHTIALFAIAAFIAFGVQPLVVRLEHRRVPRPVAIAIVFLALTLVIVLGIAVVVPLAVEQLQVLAANLPAYATTVQSWLNAGENWIREKLPSAHIPYNMFDITQMGSEKLTAYVTTALSSIGAIVLTTATIALIGFSALILSFFFLLLDKQMGEGFASMFPERRRATAHKLASEIAHLFGSYISGQVIVCLITGVVIAIATSLVGFRFSVTIGIIAGIAYAIPIFGMLIAQAIALVLCAPQGIGVVLWVQAIMFTVARISDNILVPKIMGDSVGVSPVGVMFAVFAGGELFGLPGLLLGIPAAALIKILWRYFGATIMHRLMEN